MSMKRVVVALSVVAALALPAATTLAAGHGGAGGGGHRDQHGAAARGHHQKGHNYSRTVRQLEGSVVRYDSSSLVLQQAPSRALTVTIALSTSTIITAEEGISPTLADGERVHVVANVDAAGAYTATLVRIQHMGKNHAKADDADETPEATDTPDDTKVPGATGTVEATGVVTPTGTTQASGVPAVTGTPEAENNASGDHGHGHDGGGHKR